MANILILTNKKKYPYHMNTCININSNLNDRHTVSTLDIHTSNHECLQKIYKLTPDILITLDLAGFHFRTQAGEMALNMLPTKNINLIWGHKPEYAEFLSKKLSLSMLFYDVSGTDYQLPRHYPNMLYYKATYTLDTFEELWTDFTKEVLLSQA